MKLKFGFPWQKKLINMSVTFEPREDITTYELAYIMQSLWRGTFYGDIEMSPEVWEHIPDNIKRHLR